MTIDEQVKTLIDGNMHVNGIRGLIVDGSVRVIEGHCKYALKHAMDQGRKERDETLRLVLRICDSDWPTSKGPHVTIDAIRHHVTTALGQAYERDG